MKLLLIILIIFTSLAEIALSKKSLTNSQEWFFLIVPFLCMLGSIILWRKFKTISVILLIVQFLILSMSAIKFVYQKGGYKQQELGKLHKIPAPPTKPDPGKFRLKSGGLSGNYYRAIRVYKGELRLYEKTYGPLIKDNRQILTENKLLREENKTKKGQLDLSKKENLFGVVWLILASFVLPIVNISLSHYTIELFLKPSISHEKYESLLNELKAYKKRIAEVSRSSAETAKEKQLLLRKIERLSQEKTSLGKNIKQNETVILGYAAKEFIEVAKVDRSEVAKMSGYSKQVSDRKFNKYLKEIKKRSDDNSNGKTLKLV